MRTSLLPGLLDALARNLARGVADVRAVRGRRRCSCRDARDADAARRASAASAGRAARARATAGSSRASALDFFDAKGAVEELLARARPSRRDFARRRRARRWLHPGVAGARSASASARRGRRAASGELHSVDESRARARRSRRARSCSSSTSARSARRRAARRSELPRFPAVDARPLVLRRRATSPPRAIARRDRRGARAAAASSVRVLEDYREPGKRARRARRACSGRSPIARADRTLTDAEVQTRARRAASRGCARARVSAIAARR